MVDGVLPPCYFMSMPNVRHRDKTRVNFWLTKDLYLKLKKLAKSKDTTVSELLTDWITLETKNIQLTKEDYEEILKSFKG